MNNLDWKKLIRPGLAILLAVIGCGITARFLANGETLADYAQKQGQVTFESAQAVAPSAGDSSSAADTVSKTSPAASEEISADAVKEPAAPAAAPETPDAQTTAAHTLSSITGDQETEPAESPEAEIQEQNAAVSDALTDDSDVSAERVTYAEGFFYEPIPASIYRRMVGNSYPEDCPISLDTLRYLNIRYVDFSDQDSAGEIVCAATIAEDLVEIFYDLYQARYQLESVRLVDDYGGDDDLSMYDDNTSCFNYRTVAGSTTLSNHARGLAIDINPLYNPWVNHGKVSPPESAEYADRTKDFPHKIDKDDLCCQCFVNHGFFWGGNWNNPDYQHFQKN